jgi:hypothetical protein
MAPKPLIVGKDIKKEAVYDFYYTYDASTFPPDYQRYRFYAEKGKHYFYHEKREGDHWPLTEEDATVTGNVKLSDKQWDAFWDCINCGSVIKRQEHLEDGNAGPWLFLYWDGDKGKVQEFSFADPGARARFETLSKKLAE